MPSREEETQNVMDEIRHIARDRFKGDKTVDFETDCRVEVASGGAWVHALIFVKFDSRE